MNGIDVTANVSTENDTIATPKVTITRTGPTTINCIFPNEVGMAISLVSRMLGFTVIVPERLRGLTGGLSGNYNGDPTDDVAFVNGTRVSPMVSDRVFHEVAQSCEFILMFLHALNSK